MTRGQNSKTFKPSLKKKIKTPKPPIVLAEELEKETSKILYKAPQCDFGFTLSRLITKSTWGGEIELRTSCLKRGLEYHSSQVTTKVATFLSEDI